MKSAHDSISILTELSRIFLDTMKHAYEADGSIAREFWEVDRDLIQQTIQTLKKKNSQVILN